MSAEEAIPVTQMTWARLSQSIKNLAASEAGGKAKLMFGLLIVFVFAVNGLNVLNSYVGRDFMTAIADRKMSVFVLEAVLYIGVFALSTVVSVFNRFTEDRLGLLWRHWLTQRLVAFYLDHRIYYHIDETGAVANPDERIADDVRSFTVTTLSFTLMLLNGSFTVLAFSGVLWSISPILFIAAIIYAALGTWLTIALGRPLVKLNYDQLDKEADFRSDLIHVRENAESVAMLHREGRLRSRLLKQLNALVENFQRIITVNRNLGFFTTGYNYLIQIIPVLFIAPMFINGEVEFGEITQASIAFTQLLGAFSLIVTQYQQISSYAAVVERLNALGEAIEQTAPAEIRPEVQASCGICTTPERKEPSLEVAEAIIEIIEDNDRIAFEKVSLRSSHNGETLVHELSLDIPHGCALLVKGPNDSVKVALFRAAAGIWSAGEGRIYRPASNQILFLPERPYLPPGTLREVLLHTGGESTVTDKQIMKVLTSLEVDAVLKDAEGLDVEQDWDDLLSVGEQQLLAYARMFIAPPRFAFLDRPGTALSAKQVGHILDMLAERSISYLTLGDGEDSEDRYDALLELAEDGRWTFRKLREASSQPDADRGAV